MRLYFKIIALIISVLPVFVYAESEVHTDQLFLDTSLSGGLETVNPLFTDMDTNNDGNYDRVFVQFDIYARGTNTRLLRTNKLGTNYPAIPCSNPAWVEDDWNLTSLGASESLEQAWFVVEIVVGCEENSTFEYKEANLSYMYVANIGGGGGSSWHKKWNNFSVIGHTILNGNHVTSLTVEGVGREYLEHWTLNTSGGQVSRKKYLVAIEK